MTRVNMRCLEKAKIDSCCKTQEMFHGGADCDRGLEDYAQLINHKHSISNGTRREISSNANWMINSLLRLQYGWCQAQILLEYQNHCVFMETFYDDPIWSLIALLLITALHNCR